MDAPAGWYRTDEGQMRYWDGTGWSEHGAPPPPTLAPTGAAPTGQPSGRSVPVRGRLTRSAVAGWLGWGGLLLTAALGAASSGISGLLILSGLFVLVVAVIALTRGRVRWARLRSRAAGAAASAAAIALLVTGGAIADPDPGAPVTAAPVTAPSTSSAPQRTPSPSPSPSTATPTPSPSTTTAAAAAPAPAVAPARKPSASVSPAPAARGTALAAVADLSVKGRAPKTGYSRDRFGQAWFDTDRNGCDTRNDMLRRDLVDRRMKNRCKVLAGTLAPGPYTGARIRFEYGGASEVDIDHVVALSDGWQKGAASWPAGKRLAFANDPLNLLAVDAGANRAKGDGDTATWLPPNKSYRCLYVARQVAVKRKYGLWVTTAEQSAMTRVLSACASATLPAAGRAPTVAALPSSRPTPPPTPRPEPAQRSVPKPNPAWKSAPKPTWNPAPRPARQSAPGVVHPGSYCSPVGARGVTIKGTSMRCSVKPADPRARWRKS